MARLSLITGQALPARTGVVLMARILGLGADGKRALITPDTIGAVQWHAQNLDDGSETQANTALTPSSVLFVDLQQDDLAWSKDSADNPGMRDGLWGYNFRFVVPAATFQDEATYQIDVQFTPVTGEPFYVSFRFRTVPAYPMPVELTTSDGTILTT